MELERVTFKDKMKKLLNNLKNIFASQKNTFYLLTSVLMLVVFIVVLITTLEGGFLNYSTDDIIQYYPYAASLFDKIKHGHLSLYDTTLYGGTSFFAGAYYLPFDLFTLLAFFLSFIFNAESSYAFTNLLRPVAGSLILYYFLVRKGMKNKTGFIASLIFFVGGMIQCYIVFPVYLGIITYAPLGMLLVDVVLEKRGNYYFLLPLYSITCIFFDFYMAYMLIGFTCIYFVVEMFVRGIYSFYGKKFFLFNGDFYLRFFTFMGFIILGVLMASFILIPASLYILNESSRTSGIKPDSLWYFTIRGTKEFSLRHYFTLFTSLFIPNEPHRLLLNHGTDYIREHASFYLTVGGLIYFVYFFFIKGQKENRLKVFVVLMNLLFCMPIMANIFTFNETPYSRWFFMPYMFNLYAMSYGIDKSDEFFLKNKYLKIAPFVFLTLGLGSLIYVYTKSPDIFIHYDKADPFFAPILIPSIIFIAVYLAILIFTFVMAYLKKEWKISKHLVPIMISFEFIFALLIIFNYTSGSSKRYYDNKEKNLEMMDNLVSYGYDYNSGYRINLYSASAKAQANANLLYGNVNFGRFFQSFYNVPFNYGQQDIFMDDNVSWSRNFVGGYNLLSSNLFNVKYIVSPTYKNDILALPERYYQKLGEEDHYAYHELKEMDPFIVYDEVIDNLSPYSLTKREEMVLDYAYIKKPSVDSLAGLDPKDKYDRQKISEYKNYHKYLEYHLDFADKDDVSKNIDGNHKALSMRKSRKVKEGSNYYYVYDLTYHQELFKDNNAIEVFVDSDNLRKETYDKAYLVDSLGNRHDMHYFTAYNDDYQPKELYLRVPKDHYLNDKNSTITVNTYNTLAYEKFVEKQKTYQNKEFKVDGNKFHLKVTFPDTLHKRIIKTPYAYSDDFKVLNKAYKTVNVSGNFLGIVVPKDVKEVDIEILFMPAGFEKASIVSGVSSVIYLGLLTPVVVKYFKKKKGKKDNEEDSNHCSML